MTPNFKRTAKERSQGRENFYVSRKKLKRRSLKTRRRRELSKSERLNFRDKSRLSNIVRSKKSWNSNVSLNSKDALKQSREKKRQKKSRRSSNVRLRPFLRLNRRRLREESVKWIEKTRKEGSVWRKKISVRRRKVR